MYISGSLARTRRFLVTSSNKLVATEQTKDGSIDLKVKYILTKNYDTKERIQRFLNGEGSRQYPGIEKKSTAVIRPQQTAVLISEEFFNLPKGILAHAMLKNRLSQKGLIAFNTGIIDSGYQGPVSTFVINLSNRDIEIPEGQVFMRVAFHKVDERYLPEESAKIAEEDLINKKTEAYINYRKEDLINFPNDFVGTERIKSALIDEVKDYSIGKSIFYMGLLIAVLSLFSEMILPRLNTNDSNEKIENLETRIKNLETLTNQNISELQKSLPAQRVDR
ncbi:dCTP deaminase domain-containing protein [Marinobacter nauticus]|uniref:dCTP deaminase domain-containing protein n=1 Tax=Marinobacter nauticus TaxID=2743 RepID=UPI001C9591B1|nr:hypothetical protein [Marinobacter nauticus]MBY6220012.1 hypothetical protein [Marinobacter nauticus]